MSAHRLLLVLPVLAGCLDIRAEGGNDLQAYEGAIAGLLRAGTLALYEVDGNFPKHSELAAAFTYEGKPLLRVDPYRWDLDHEWDQFAVPFAVEIQESQGAMLAGEDNFHWERRGGFFDGDYTVSLYCQDELELFVQTETAAGWRQGTALLGPAPATCDSGVLLGASAAPDEQVLWLGQPERVRFTPPADVGDIGIERIPLATPPGAPDEVVWIASEAPDAVAIAGRTAGVWTFAETAGPAQTAPAITGDPLGTEPVRRVDPSTIEVWTTDGRWSWDVRGTGVATPMDGHPPPSVDGPWVRGPWAGGALALERALIDEALGLEVVVGAQALLEEGGLVSVVDLPRTACSEDEPCEGLGQWTAVGLFHYGGQWYAVYDYYSWWYGVNAEDITAVYLAPIVVAR